MLLKMECINTAVQEIHFQSELLVLNFREKKDPVQIVSFSVVYDSS